jgi:outer membrane biosynthesis protein TonB
MNSPHLSKAVVGALIAISWINFPVAAAEAVIEGPNFRRLERPILFPAACLRAAAAKGGEVAVDVDYEIGRGWRARKIRVRDSSDPCFDEAAIASVRTDLFLRRDKKKNASPVGTYHHRIIFTPVDPSRPPAGVQAERVPPVYPQRCFQGAARLEIVVSAFDINGSGATENIRTVDSTNSCLDEAAGRSIQ